MFKGIYLLPERFFFLLVVLAGIFFIILRFILSGVPQFFLLFEILLMISRFADRKNIVQMLEADKGLSKRLSFSASFLSKE